jgi:hypothetical protein
MCPNGVLCNDRQVVVGGGSSRPTIHDVRDDNPRRPATMFVLHYENGVRQYRLVSRGAVAPFKSSIAQALSRPFLELIMKLGKALDSLLISPRSVSRKMKHWQIEKLRPRQPPSLLFPGSTSVFLFLCIAC